jgi:hypothetical protein
MREESKAGERTELCTKIGDEMDKMWSPNAKNKDKEIY